MLMMLTKYECSVNSTNKEGTALVLKAVENDTPQISSLFIQRNCNLMVRTPYGKTLMEMCIEKTWYLHVTYILGNGCKELNDDEDYFHRMCHLSIMSNSTLIFDKLVKHYFASKLQRAWKRHIRKRPVNQ